MLQLGQFSGQKSARLWVSDMTLPPLLKLVPNAGEMRNGVSWDWEVKVRELKKGCFKCSTSLVRQHVHYTSLPSWTCLSEQGCYCPALFWVHTSGSCSLRRSSQLMSRHLTAWDKCRNSGWLATDTVLGIPCTGCSNLSSLFLNWSPENILFSSVCLHSHATYQIP